MNARRTLQPIKTLRTRRASRVPGNDLRLQVLHRAMISKDPVGALSLGAEKQHAYRKLLEYALVEMRDPQYGVPTNAYFGALADALHHLARFSADDFQGFSEELFWAFVFDDLKGFPRAAEALEKYFRHVLAQRQAAVTKAAATTSVSEG